MLLVISIAFALVIHHFQSHNLRGLSLLVACAVPCVLTYFLGFLGLGVSIFYTGSMIAVEFPTAAIASRGVVRKGRGGWSRL